ncbi:MAG: hypothetical protein ACOC2Z_00445 [Coleofasciculus sp.]
MTIIQTPLKEILRNCPAIHTHRVDGWAILPILLIASKNSLSDIELLLGDQQHKSQPQLTLANSAYILHALGAG